MLAFAMARVNIFNIKFSIYYLIFFFMSWHGLTVQLQNLSTTKIEEKIIITIETQYAFKVQQQLHAQ